ncbi:hypothetical protein Pmani_022719 [Petrolisthes manimaculis]|uniref:BHLH domain-containing protein n=1 Tax=Petrolisthes manimaculis TaxID=1843537 RepID=A0AAE1PC82_9EUCA|nr:hypothetical protein Pmani_022719 [Petrolisthes manimaculis]
MEGRARRNNKTAMKGVGGVGSRGKRPLTDGSLVNPNEYTATGTSKNALRERTRVESLRRAYLELQAAIPSVPPNTKLSKLDVLVLATTYISHLSQLLQEDDDARAHHHHHHHHDPNNNNSTTTNTNTNNSNSKSLLSCHLPHSVCLASDTTTTTTTTRSSSSRPSQHHQKGLLHPVKKWPMRARLYAGVGANPDSTTTLMMDHSSSPVLPPPPHLYSSNPHHRITPSQFHLSTTNNNNNNNNKQHHHHHRRQQQQQHGSTLASHLKTPVEFQTGISEGHVVSPTADFGTVGDAADKTYAYPSWLGSQNYTTGSYLEAWETEGGSWGPGMTYESDVVGHDNCHAPCQITQPYATHHTRWEDRVM